MYIKREIQYIRRADLEGVDSHIIVIDIPDQKKSSYRLINIYRSFNPQGGHTPTSLFNYQLDLIKLAFNSNTLLIGDINLDHEKRHDVTYSKRRLFDDFDTKLGDLDLIQFVNFPTWTRMIGNNLKFSTLDHIYAKDPSFVSNLDSNDPIFGDHLMISFNIPLKKPEIEFVYKRDWRLYKKENLIKMLSQVNWIICDDNVQNCWNDIENILIKIVDKLAPLTKYKNNSVVNNPPPKHIKSMISSRKRALKLQKQRPSVILKQKIKELNCQIRNFFHSQKRLAVRRGIIPGSSISLWSAVKIAKDMSVADVPGIMYRGQAKIPNNKLSQSFADFFKKKINDITDSVLINPQVYNGKRKMFARDEMFMNECNIT